MSRLESTYFRALEFRWLKIFWIFWMLNGCTNNSSSLDSQFFQTKYFYFVSDSSEVIIFFFSLSRLFSNLQISGVLTIFLHRMDSVVLINYMIILFFRNLSGIRIFFRFFRILFKSSNFKTFDHVSPKTYQILDDVFSSGNISGFRIFSGVSRCYSIRRFPHLYPFSLESSWCTTQIIFVERVDVIYLKDILILSSSKNLIFESSTNFLQILWWFQSESSSLCSRSRTFKSCSHSKSDSGGQ